MMGRRENGQGQFFYSFDFDEVVPPDHLVRQAMTEDVSREASEGANLIGTSPSQRIAPCMCDGP